ncbi:hypothetical protein ASE40_02765 [Flavobacterium sp. Root935]|nr:hypothetical protein ASE40_02765 [Flavobacterium sp. Root935]
MEFFLNGIADKLVKAIQNDFNEVLKVVNVEVIYSISLVTDSDTSSLFFALNTIEYMQKKDEEYLKSGLFDKMNFIYKTKWIPAE